MSALLKQFSLFTESRAKHYVDIYTHTLKASLTLEDGALDVLKALKERPIRIAVISEGPHDAQEQILRDLSLTPYVDMLMTSNRERVSKQQGLYGIWMQREAISANQALVVGDSLSHDIYPSEALGLPAIHYAKNGGSTATKSIRNLREILDLMG